MYALESLSTNSDASYMCFFKEFNVISILHARSVRRWNLRLHQLGDAAAFWECSQYLGVREVGRVAGSDRNIHPPTCFPGLVRAGHTQVILHIREKAMSNQANPSGG